MANCTSSEVSPCSARTIRILLERLQENHDKPEVVARLISSMFTGMVEAIRRKQESRFKHVFFSELMLHKHVGLFVKVASSMAAVSVRVQYRFFRPRHGVRL
jgi:hypothetical protein